MLEIQLNAFYQTKHDSDEYVYTIGYSPNKEKLYVLTAFKHDEGTPYVPRYFLEIAEAVPTSTFNDRYHL